VSNTPKILLKPRRLSIRLRMLMLVVLVIALLVGRTVNQARARKSVVTAILESHGAYHCDGQEHARNHNHTKLSHVRKWLADHLGEEYSCDVNEIHFWYHEPDPNLTERLTAFALPRLETLELTGGKISDTCMSHVGKLTSLQYLNLDQASFSDRAFAQIATLKNLRTLYLFTDDVTDSSLYYLKDLNELRLLGVGGSNLTGSGLKYLAGLRHLTTLGIWLRNDPDAHLAGIGSLSNLEELSIDSWTDESLPADWNQLKKLSRLRLLDYQGGTLPDGLAVVVGTLSNLEELNLHSGEISEEWLGPLSGLSRLKAFRASLKISDIRWPAD
jgi:Leucine-rich repeat (LRR) protein